MTSEKKEGLSRRQAIVAGTLGILGTGTLGGCGLFRADEDERDGRAAFPAGPDRPLYLGPEGTKEPSEHARVENLFWCERLTEHADFFAMLMPGVDLEPERAQAQEFQDLFRDRFDLARGHRFTKDTYVAFNRATIELAKRFMDWKFSMREAQVSGKIQTLVWSSFFEAAAVEVQRFIARLEHYNRGNVELDRKEVVSFWSHDTAGHLSMIAHMLDPLEKTLVSRALEMSDRWRKVDPEAAGDAGDPLLQAEQEVIDFKTAIYKGIDTARVQSIMHPAMADHMKREGLRFIDELKRSA